MNAKQFLDSHKGNVVHDESAKLCTHKAALFLDKNFDNNELRVKDFASSMHMSERSLRRKSLLLFQLSPSSLLEKFRIQTAKAMILEGIPVSDVSLAVGYCSHAHFSTQFKKLEGVSPIEYRNKHI